MRSAMHGAGVGGIGFVLLACDTPVRVTDFGATPCTKYSNTYSNQ